MAWEHRSVAPGFCDCAALSFTLCFEQICLCYCSICAGTQRSYTDSYQQPCIVGKAKCEPLQRGASFCFSCGSVEMWSLKFVRKSSSRSCSVQMVNCISNRVATFLSLLIRMQELGWIAWSLTLVASREAREWWFIILVYLSACVVVFMFSFYCFSTTRTFLFPNFSLICGWDFVSVYSQTVQGTK
jgi:hypothetical protein